MASLTSQAPTYKSQSKGKGSGSRTVKGMGKANTRGVRKRGKTKMPTCRFGSACRRKGCIYLHKRNPETTSSSRSDVCKHFLSGSCLFGASCSHRHLDESERVLLRRQYSGIVCLNGADCQTWGCLYAHPWWEENSCTTSLEQFPISQIPAALSHSWSDRTVRNGGSGNADSKRSELSSISCSSGGGLSVTAPSWAPECIVPASLQIKQDSPVCRSGSSETPPGTSRWIPGGTWDTSLIPQVWPKRKGGVVNNVSNRVGDKLKTVLIPESVWTPSYTRNPDLFQISDPIARFRKVNASAPEGVIDLHYQTKSSCGKVLDTILPEYELSRVNSVWVVTGTGHHRGGHQAEGVLFATCKTYLIDNGYNFAVGKTRGLRVSGGAFLVSLS